MHLLISLILLFLLPACNVSPLSEADKSMIDTYSVISLFGTEYSVMKKGLMRHNNEKTVFKLASKSFDSLFEKQFVSQIGSQREFVKLEIPEEARKLYSPLKLFGENKWLSPVMMKAREHEVHYIFVIRPVINPDDSIFEHGPGVLCRTIGPNQNAVAYMQIGVQLINTQSEKVVFTKSFYASSLIVETENTCTPGSLFDDYFEALVMKAVSVTLQMSGLTSR